MNALATAVTSLPVSTRTDSKTTLLVSRISMLFTELTDPTLFSFFLLSRFLKWCKQTNIFSVLHKTKNVVFLFFYLIRNLIILSLIRKSIVHVYKIHHTHSVRTISERSIRSNHIREKIFWAHILMQHNKT